VGSEISEVVAVNGRSLMVASSFRDTLLVIQATRRGWEVGATPFPSFIYGTIARIDNNTNSFFVTYVEGNAIHAGEFDLSANAIKGVATVASFATRATVQTRALAPSNVRRVIVWLESTFGTQHKSQLRIAESTDAGRTWKASVPLSIESGSGSLQADYDTAGSVHVILDPAYETPSAPIHLVRADHVWRQDTLPTLKGFVVPSPTIRSWKKDSLLALWSMAESQSSPPVTFWSIGKRCWPTASGTSKR
jgi:hypothetical protein